MQQQSRTIKHITSKAGQAGCLGFESLLHTQGGPCVRCGLSWEDHQLGTAEKHQLDTEPHYNIATYQWSAHEPTQSQINALAADVHQWAKDKGFWDIPPEIEQAMMTTGRANAYIDRLIRTQKMALITTETSEAVEAVRKDHSAPSEHIPEFTAEEEEIADQMIRLLDYAGRYKLRLGQAIDAKMTFNAGRPRKHGKAF